MLRRIGYGRAMTDAAASHIVGRLRDAGCATIVIDRGTGNDPQPEWVRLRAALRAGDLLIIATLPAHVPHARRARAELGEVAALGVRVEVLPGARPAPQTPRTLAASASTDPDKAPDAATLSAGQIRRTYQPTRPQQLRRPPQQAGRADPHDPEQQPAPTRGGVDRLRQRPEPHTSLPQTGLLDGRRS